MLENGLIPPTVHFKKENPNIPFGELNVKVATGLSAWPKDKLRRISTNSFGYGGTNAHAILEDASSYLKERGISSLPAPHDDHALPNSASPRIFLLSTQDKEGLNRIKKPLAQYVDSVSKNCQDSNTFLSQLAYTLSNKRSYLQWKAFTVASSTEELCEKLHDGDGLSVPTQSSKEPRLGFVFTGQGAQWAGMGQELMAYETFSNSVKAADKFLKDECGCGWSAIEELGKGKSTSQLHLAEYSQTLCTVLQVALLDLLATWKISPVATAGHSSGEIAAAYAMGALTREDAWKIAYFRGVLSSEMKIDNPDLDGSMMAAGLSPEKAEEWVAKVDKEVVVACINSPSSVTLSGDTAGIDQLLEMLQKAGVFARKLQVDTAYHSPHMQSVAQEYYETLSDVTPMDSSKSCTMHSSVYGHTVTAKDLGAMYYVKNLTSPVRFSDAIYDLVRPMKDGTRADQNTVDLLVEIGPHSALQGPATQSLKARKVEGIPYYSMLTRNQNAVDTALNLAGSLYAQGYKVDIHQVNTNGDARPMKPLVDLPTYPWNHQRYWHESRIEDQYLHRKHPKTSLIGAPHPSLGSNEFTWRGFIRPSEQKWISDHKIQGDTLYPGAGYIAMALEAACQTADSSKKIASLTLRDIQLNAAAILSDDSDMECIVQLRPHLTSTKDSASTWTEFTVTTSPDRQSLVKNCYGLLLIEYEGDVRSDERDFEIRTIIDEYAEAKDQCRNPLDITSFYEKLWAMGLQYGPTFANVIDARNGDGSQSWGLVEIADIAADIPPGSDRPHIIHPSTLDAIFHLAFAAINGGKTNATSAFVPKSIEEIQISANIAFKAGTALPGFSNAQKHGLKDLKADIVMLDADENVPTVNIQGFTCSEVRSGSSNNSGEGVIQPITSKNSWKPAIDLLSPQDIDRVLESSEGIAKLVEVSNLS
jgi:acyl transferase domain-containing protein